MTRTLFHFLLILAALSLAACGDDAGGETKGGTSHADGDQDHVGEGQDQDGEEHDDHEDHGEKTDMGTKSAGSAKVTLGLFGKVAAGFEAIMDIEIEDMVPEAVRVWVGVESGKGSMKSKLDGEDGDYHGHVDVPTKLPEGSAIWIELEAPGGERHRVSYPISS